MKKMKLVLLAAMIIGTASAFTTTKPTTDGIWVKGPDGDGITLAEGIERGGYCDGDGVCQFTNQALTDPAPNSPVGTFTYDSK